MKLFCAILAIALFSSPSDAAEVKYYKFDEMKCSIACNPRYEVKRMKGAVEATVCVVLYEGKDSKSFKPNITISSAPNTKPPLDLDTFFNVSLQNFLKDPNFKIVLSGQTKLGNREVYQLVYTHRVKSGDSSEIVPIKVMLVYAIEPSRVYVINYVATEKDYETYLPEAKKIFGSFKTL